MKPSFAAARIRGAACRHRESKQFIAPVGGDDLSRDQAVDLAVWGQIAAEDLYVGNLLEMGNITGTHFKQPAWGQAGRFERDGRVLVSGQEDP